MTDALRAVQNGERDGLSPQDVQELFEAVERFNANLYAAHMRLRTRVEKIEKRLERLETDATDTAAMAEVRREVDILLARPRPAVGAGNFANE